MSLPAFRTRRSRAYLLRHNADSFHPLHVGLWRDHAYKFFGRDTESLCTLKLDRINDSSSSSLASPSADTSSSSSSSFVTVILVDSLEFVTTEDRLQLLCSDLFLSHHGFSDAEPVFVRPVVTFPLRRLTLTTVAAGGDDGDVNAALSWLRAVVNRGDFRAALCVGGVASRRLVARRGDFLPLPTRCPIFVNDPDFRPDFLSRVFVVECGPIHQGHLAVDTDVSVVETESSFERPSFANNSARPVVEDGEPLDERFDVESSSTPSATVVRPRVLKTEVDFRRRLNFLRRGAKKSSAVSQIIDDLRVVFVGVATAKKLLGKSTAVKPGRSGGWALVSVDRERETEKSGEYSASLGKRSRSSRDYALSNLVVLPRGCGDEEEDVALITPALMYNINKKPTCGIADASELRLRLEIPAAEMIDPLISHKKSPTRSKASSSVAPPFATEVHISTIATPSTVRAGPQRLFRQSFRRYFERPRIVCQGDTICLDVSTDPDFFDSPTANANNNNNNNNNNGDDRYLFKKPRMFYKVVKVKSHVDGVRFCLVDSHHTSLIQAGVVNDPVPASMARWFRGEGDGYLGLMEEWEDDDDDEEKVPPPNYFRKYVRRLKKLISPVLDDDDEDESSVNAEERNASEDAIARILISGPKCVGKTSLIEKVAADCRLNCWPVDCLSLAADTLAATEAKLKNVFFKALDVVPCVLLLKGVHHLAKDPSSGDGGGGGGEPRVAAALKRIVASVTEARRRFPLILVGTTHDDTLVAPQVHDLFLHRVSVRPPSMREREELLGRIFRGERKRNSKDEGGESGLNLFRVAQQTSGFLVGDLLALVASARREACRRVLSVLRTGNENENDSNEDEENSFHSWRLQEDLLSAGFGLTSNDVDDAVDSLLLSRGGGRFVDGDCGIPTTRWEDIGGFEGAKRKIRDTLSLPLSRPDLFAPRTACSGILLHGPPGTGKTLFAKAIATELTLNFVSIKGPELLNMYVGQSEANVRRVFQDARDASPCVVFFDELDALVPNRGFAGDAGGVMDRVVSQMCAELDGLRLIDEDVPSSKESATNCTSRHDESDSTMLFVIGATNRPDLIDPALLRPGRLEKQIYLGPAEDPDDALAIFRAVTKDFRLHKNCSVEAVARMCPTGMTGAEIADLCSEALTKALERKVRYVERKRETDSEFRVTEADADVIVDESDFVHALSQGFGRAYV